MQAGIRRRNARSALEQAIDQKIEEQHQFVAWWKGSVGKPGPKKDVPGTRYISFVEAENLTGMKQQRVSDLGKRLGQPDKYRLNCSAPAPASARKSARCRRPMRGDELPRRVNRHRAARTRCRSLA
jgi:hypothetical protein